MSDFADFADTMARTTRATPAPVRRFDRVAVLGGGADARLIAAIALSEGAAVTLFSAYGTELDALRGGGGIALRGAGPVGSYQVDAEAAPSVRTTAELDHAVLGAELIFLTGPVHKQRTYAMVLAEHLRDGQVLVLAPARTFGALEARWLLRIGGCSADITLIEATGLPFWFSASGATLNLSDATPAVAGTWPTGRADVLAAIEPYLPGMAAPAHPLTAAFADGSALIELPALMLGGAGLTPGGPTIPMGGTPLPENNTFRNLVGAEQTAIIADLAAERREVARLFGVRDLPETEDWLVAHAGTPSGDGARPVPGSAEARGMIRDGVIGSLVPLVSAAELVGAPVPVTSAMVSLASSMLGADLASAGRRLAAMGVTATDADGARRQLAALAEGA